MSNDALNLIIKILSGIFILLLIAYVAVTMKNIGYEIFADEPLTSQSQAVEATIVVTEEDTLLDIAKDLKNKHIIDNPYYFVIAVHFLDDYDQIKPGTYTLSSADSPSQILATLTAREEEGAKPDDMLRTGCRQTVTGIEEPA